MDYFQVAGREIGNPRVLICPKDTRVKGALDFESPGTAKSFASPSFQNSALSYFYGADASEDQPNLILAGDRNISTNARILTGLLVANTNTPLSWTKDIKWTQRG
jgi:hypothetical protein